MWDSAHLHFVHEPAANTPFTRTRDASPALQPQGSAQLTALHVTHTHVESEIEGGTTTDRALSHNRNCPLCREEGHVCV
jgi:hypothetical protein